MSDIISIGFIFVGVPFFAFMTMYVIGRKS